MLDAAVLFRLAVEQCSPADRFHGVAEEGVPFRAIADAIGRNLNLPVVSKSAEEAKEHFGWFAMFAGFGCTASNALTRKRLGWNPAHRALIDDLDQGRYFEAAAAAT